MAKTFQHNNVNIVVKNESVNEAEIMVGDRTVKVKGRHETPVGLGEWVEECRGMADALRRNWEAYLQNKEEFAARENRVERLNRQVDEMKRADYATDADFAHELSMRADSVQSAINAREGARRQMDYSLRSFELACEDIER